ncbi:MarR family winged helix-turn-helix transcriptional regulator [Listeria innocua]|uniref:MarR family winged helix-turn-helix transcriptional regulator n=1 Tax=Bacilli TaxID=91061 RepID=UPI0015CBFFEF|nr:MULTISPECIES: MarR family winged helix-turn-helix transcriptional regulator [Bacilli]EME7221966.1 winged helix-turn-helix transcriptional regulator [Enterococcus faecium]MCO4669683.1 transcriptional regulator, MarR family [Streptococcus infantarius subsp. infantarius]EFQ6832991.1 winged helix-turn-helix transcriptional regulator [Listeria monocytogenes]EHD4905476.1 winged helix-turn-helix transcriptional regulator [Listeria monocytogenes]EHD4917604.1 winged helix-turn-helix transcriptional 
MKKSLENELVQSIFRFKKLVSKGFGMDLINNNNQLNITELMLINEISDNTLNSEENVGISDVKEFLSVSKPAVSQMLSSLEKRGFLVRDVDKNNRRNVIVTLTDTGREVLSVELENFNIKLKKIISHLGEDDVKQMIEIVNRMILITNELNSEEN